MIIFKETKPPFIENPKTNRLVRNPDAGLTVGQMIEILEQLPDKNAKLLVRNKVICDIKMFGPKAKKAGQISLS